MSNQNIETTKKAYAAFASGDLGAVLAAFDDAVEWTIPGESMLSGTYRGTGELSELLQRLGERSTAVQPEMFLADGDVVVVLAQVSVAGGRYPEADVYTFGDGKIIKARSFGDTAAQERIFGTKRSAARV